MLVSDCCTSIPAPRYHGWQKVRTLVRLTLDGGTVKSLDVIELARGER